MNQASKIESDCRALRLETSQAYRILAILDTAGFDFMVEHLPGGLVRVETEQRGAVDGFSCTGSDLVDALGQLTQVLAGEIPELVDQFDDQATHVDADQPIPYAFEAPVEFAKPCSYDDPNDYRAHMASELGANFIEAIAE